MHLLHLAYQTPQLSPAYLKRTQSTYLSLQLAKSLTASLFDNKELNTSCNLLNTALKVKTEQVVWAHNGCKCTGYLPSWVNNPIAATAQHHERVP